MDENKNNNFRRFVYDKMELGYSDRITTMHDLMIN
jgi:hypothetical protein